MNIDETDVNLLNTLSERGRMPLRAIASKLGVSTVTVSNRVKKLENLGLLKGFTTIIDPIKAGFEITAIINLKAKGKHIEDAEAGFRDNPSISGIYDVTGEWDAILIGRFKSMRELNHFIKKALAKEWVEDTHTHIVLNVVKEDYRVRL